MSEIEVFMISWYQSNYFNLLYISKMSEMEVFVRYKGLVGQIFISSYKLKVGVEMGYWCVTNAN